jgi:hypothetical protein
MEDMKIKCLSYGKYPYCKQCRFTQEKCKDYKEG